MQQFPAAGSNGWVPAILGIILLSSALTNGQLHERTTQTEELSQPSRGNQRFSAKDLEAEWDPKKENTVDPITQVQRQSNQFLPHQSVNQDNRRSNYRTESRKDTSSKGVDLGSTRPRISDGITKVSDDERTRSSRRHSSQRFGDAEPVNRRRVTSDVDSNLNITPTVPRPTKQSQILQRQKSAPRHTHDDEYQTKNTQRNGRVVDKTKTEYIGRDSRTSRNFRTNARVDTRTLTEPIAENSNHSPVSNRRIDILEVIEHKETLIDQEVGAASNVNYNPAVPRPTRESKTSKRENIVPDTNELSKVSRNPKGSRRLDSGDSQRTEPVEKPSRGLRNNRQGTDQSVERKSSRRQQTINVQNAENTSTKNVLPSPRPTRESRLSGRGRAQYSTNPSEEPDTRRGRERNNERNVERSRDSLRSGRLSSRNNGAARQVEDEPNPVGRSRTNTRREKPLLSEEGRSKTNTEADNRRGLLGNRRGQVFSRNSATTESTEAVKKDAPLSRRGKKPAEDVRESRRGLANSRRPSTQSTDDKINKATQEGIKQPRTSRTKEEIKPPRARGRLALSGQTTKPKKSLDFEINDDDNYPQEFLQKIRQSSVEIQTPLTSSKEDVVDVEEASVTNVIPTAVLTEVPVTTEPPITSARPSSRASAFNSRRTKPSTSRNTNNVTPVPDTTLPSIPRVHNSRLHNSLRPRAGPRTRTVTEASTSQDPRPQVSKPSSLPESDNAIVPEEEVPATVSTVEALLPTPNQSPEVAASLRPGFRPRQPYVSKQPRPSSSPELTSPFPTRNGPGNLRPKPTQQILSRTNSDLGRQISPQISTRLRSVTSAETNEKETKKATDAASRALPGLQRPTLSSRLRALNSLKPQISQEHESIEGEVREEENLAKPTFKPRFPSLRESGENQERTKFKPRAKDPSVPKYTSGFRRNLPGTTSFESSNEVRTTTQLSGVGPKHRFSSRYRSELIKGAGRSTSTPAYVATVPTISTTTSTSTTTAEGLQVTGPRPRQRSRSQMMHIPWEYQ